MSVIGRFVGIQWRVFVSYALCGAIALSLTYAPFAWFPGVANYVLISFVSGAGSVGLLRLVGESACLGTLWRTFWYAVACAVVDFFLGAVLLGFVPFCVARGGASVEDVLKFVVLGGVAFAVTSPLCIGLSFAAALLARGRWRGRPDPR